MLDFENLDKANFLGVGKYDTPVIQPEHIDVRHLEWIPFDKALVSKDRATKGVHFYCYDFLFVRVWNNPDRYLDLLSQFGAVCSPDFTVVEDRMPLSMQIYNHYRKQWLGAYWQAHGIHVIPTLCWGDNASFDWCLDGTPKHSIVSISSVGTQNSEFSKKQFSEQCRKALDILEPSEILWYGKCPEEFDWNVTKIKPRYDAIKQRRLKAHGQKE